MGSFYMGSLHMGMTNLSSIGILPGWHGMENGQKPEMEKKNGNRNVKTAPSWTGAKLAKNGNFEGVFRDFSILEPFFLPFLPPSRLGPFSISISIFLFFPFPAFGRFPCHTSPAGSQFLHDVSTVISRVFPPCCAGLPNICSNYPCDPRVSWPSGPKIAKKNVSKLVFFG